MWMLRSVVLKVGIATLSIAQSSCTLRQVHRPSCSIGMPGTEVRAFLPTWSGHYLTVRSDLLLTIDHTPSLPRFHLSFSRSLPSMSNYLYLDTHSPRRQQQYYLQSHPSCSCVCHHPQYSIHRNGNGRMVSMASQVLPPPRFNRALHQVTPHPPSGGGRSLDPRAQSFFVSVPIRMRTRTLLSCSRLTQWERL